MPSWPGSVDEASLYIRLRAICCSVWGIPPPEFERLAEEGRIAAEDAIEAMLLWGSSGLGSNPMEYLFREEQRAKRDRLRDMRELVTRLRGTSDPPARLAIQREIQRLQGCGQAGRA